MPSVNRHSTIVTWVKVILPILGILLLSSLFLFSRAPNPDAAIPFADVDVEQIARDQRLSEPRFAGLTEDGREITLVSRTAVPSPERQTLIFLDIVEGRIDLSDENFMLLNARDGAVDMTAQIADLDGEVQVVTSQGYRLNTDSMDVALSDAHLTAPGVVEITGPGLRLQAGAMEMVGPDGSAVVSFTGGVRLLYERNE